MNADDIMTSPVVTVQPDTPVAQIAKILLERRISGVPVVDRDGQIAGMVSEADFMHREEPDVEISKTSWILDVLRGPPASSASIYVKNHGLVAGEVMSSPVVSITGETCIHDIVRLFERKRIKRLPVLKDGQLVGIVSRSDLLALVPKNGDEVSDDTPIDDEKIETSLKRSLDSQTWARSPYVYYVVEEGCVRFWGMVDTLEQKKAFELAARLTPGVKRVFNHLTLIQPYFFYGE